MVPNDKKLSIGFSPCPNDTFIFHGLVHGLVCKKRISLEREVVADVETLNKWAMSARLDITKLSFQALGHVLDDYVLLSAGSALGRNCGPLLVTGQKKGLDSLCGKIVAIPGRFTTAAMLLKLFAPECKKTVAMRFDEIMDSISKGNVDAGVIIHESRFTYHRYGLTLIRDLGEWWENTTGNPIPLGGIAARRSLGKDLIAKIDQCIHESVQHAFSNPGQCMKYIKSHALEMDDAVINDHIGLYVNNYSKDLGLEGIRAIQEFFRLGRDAGIIPRSNNSLQLNKQG